MNAEQIKEMMENWNKTEAAVRSAYPSADSESIYKMTAAAMSKSLGL